MDKKDTSPPLKVTFAPGCFDQFEGTQAELDEMIAAIEKMAASGELAKRAIPVSEKELAALAAGNLSEPRSKKLN
jgi:hypothetical protein